QSVLVVAGWEPEPCREQVDQGDLALDELAASGVEIEPARAIDLRKPPSVPGPGRPLHLEGVAGDAGDVDVALERPCADALAARPGALGGGAPRRPRAGRPRAPLRRARPPPSGSTTRPGPWPPRRAHPCARASPPRPRRRPAGTGPILRFVC